MAAPVPLRSDFDAEALRVLAKGSRDPAQTRRPLALSVIAAGGSRSEAAEIGGGGLQTVRDWVVAFNADGPDGLIDGKAPGARPRLNADQRDVLKALVEQGPTPAVHGVVRWRLCDLAQILSEDHGVSVSEQTLSRVLRAMGYAKGNGGATGGLLETTFREETETDLFGEQAVLCGGAKELVIQGFNTLVEAGYQPEIAYFECLHELKLIVDLFYEGGISKMHHFISETAKYGAVASGPRVVTEETKARMKTILDEIQDGTFARNWIAENEAGKPQYEAWLKADRESQIEQVGARLRERMAWLNTPKAEAA